MAIFEWRKSNLFDLKHTSYKEKILEALKEAEISCGISGKGQIILCDTLGYIHVIYRNWEYISFKGHDLQILLASLSLENNLLVTVANDDNSEFSSFKVWNLSKINKINGASCLRTVKTTLQKPTALGVSENGQYMAIGFDRGGITLYRGDIRRDRSKVQKNLSGGITSITGIAFKQNGKLTHMFVCSDSGVLVYNLQSKDREIKTVLEDTCAPTRCCVLQSAQISNEGHFIIGRDKAIYCYTVDGRGPCYVLDGQKIIIDWFRTHLIVITKNEKNIFPSQKDHILTVIDIQNNIIAFTAPIDNVIAVLIEFGTCFLITKDKEIYNLDEKDLQNKLNLLFKKNLYDIAIRIAENHKYDDEGMAGIFKQYGDHLYEKGIYSGAVDQYIKTIRYLEPSYVIQKFFDSRHIHYLTDYFQALHKCGLATEDHTTLLLNCFTRLDQIDKLKEFLSNDDPDLVFDLDVAIKVCRNSSIDLALSLAKRNKKHDYSISILVEDMKNYEEAIEYISTLSSVDAEQILKKYGSILMKVSPNHTTQMCKRLCGKTTENVIISETCNNEIKQIDPTNFMHLFYQHSDQLKEFLEYLVANNNKCNQIVYHTLIELYLEEWHHDKKIEDRILDLLKTYENIYDKDHILVLCGTYKFWPGVLWIYEKEKMYHLVIRFYLKSHDYNNLLTACKRLGSLQPSLWLQVLNGLKNDEMAPPNLLSKVLNVIATEKLQSPLQVLKCISVENGPNLSHIKEYFLQYFQKEAESVKKEEEEVNKLKSDIIELENLIENLRLKPVEFRSTICNTCNRPLTLPTIYFLCRHSFHQECIRNYSENEKECSICHDRNMQLLKAIEAQNESRHEHETFHDLLNRSHDPFSLVSLYFGRGLFNKVMIVDEQDNLEINQNDIQINEEPFSYKNIQTKNPCEAEGKIRLTEGITKTANPSTFSMPKSEGRMRMEEAQRYSTNNSVKPSYNPKIFNQIKSSNVKKANTSVKNITKSNYDESKNPFAEDEINETKAGNPFEEEYDDNLNPFN